MTNARHRFGTVLAAAAMVALTGCSNGSTEQPAAAPTPSVSVSASASHQPTADASASSNLPTIEQGKDGKPDYCKDQRSHKFTGEAAKKWGAEKVMDAYCDMVTLAMDQSFVPDLMRKHSDFRAVEFSIPADWMTVNARTDWDQGVAQIVKDPEQNTGVSDLMLYNLRITKGWDFYPAGEQPTMLHQFFSAGDTWVDHATARDRLGLEFTVGGDLLIEHNNHPWLIPVKKKTTHWLIRNGTHPTKPWLIDGWDSDLTFGTPKRFKSGLAATN